MTTPPSNSPSSARAGVSRSSDVPLLVRALRCQKVERVPVWLMRQAGRYMEEYREVRRKTDFLRLCKSPALCAEVMATAVDRLGVDAAIIFSDLLPILEPLGFELTYAPGDGPIIGNPLREPSDLAPLDSQVAVVRQTRRVIPKDKAVIGLAGAPFTLAGYAIEGRSSRTFERTRALMRSEPSLWHDGLGLIARSVARVVNA
ncbi:MAG: uroporphyrinogen decarboxylase, partial [Thermoguttaceae bacterium]|nr:uroporphyrinogen decarboxylase [Thermoguttaceae bacterium]